MLLIMRIAKSSLGLVSCAFDAASNAVSFYSSSSELEIEPFYSVSLSWLPYFLVHLIRFLDEALVVGL